MFVLLEIAVLEMVTVYCSLRHKVKNSSNALKAVDLRISRVKKYC